MLLEASGSSTAVIVPLSMDHGEGFVLLMKIKYATGTLKCHFLMIQLLIKNDIYHKFM